MKPQNISRRRLLTAGAVAGAIPIVSAGAAVVRGEMPWKDGKAAAPLPELAGASGYQFFTSAEAAFIEAAVARIIPADDTGPGAIEAGVPVFIDRQLAGEYGRAERWYMQGPWGQGEPTQGYQSRLTPAGLYRAAIREIDGVSQREGGAVFAKRQPADQDALLLRLDKGQLTLPNNVDGRAFFDLLLQNTQEGFWSDPLYGGNRGMAGWKLIGFPGAHYDYTPYVKRHGERVPLPPVGIRGRAEWNRS
jgi:gluconate 2-dehydrogenase gamma chain